MIQYPAAYVLEWKPGDYCIYSLRDFQREKYSQSARIFPLFLVPMPGCQQEAYAYWSSKTGHYIQAKYMRSNAAETYPDIVPLYRGPEIHDGEPVSQ